MSPPLALTALLAAFGLPSCALLTPDAVSVGYLHGDVDFGSSTTSTVEGTDFELEHETETEVDVGAFFFALSWDLSERASARQVTRLERQLARLEALLLAAQGADEGPRGSLEIGGAR